MSCLALNTENKSELLEKDLRIGAQSAIDRCVRGTLQQWHRNQRRVSPSETSTGQPVQ